MNLWAVLGNVAAALLILVIVLAIIVAVMTATAVVIGIIMAIKDNRRKKQINELPDKMMEQAAAGLKEREERNNDADRRGDTKADEYRQDNSRKDG